MRARLLFVTVLLLAVPATASAQLPQASEPGIRVSRSPGGRVTISFLDTAAGRRAFRPYAGRTVTLRCQAIADRVFGTGPVGVATAKVRFRSSLSTLRLRVRGNVNLCTFGAITVAMDTPAKRFLADLELSSLLPDLAGQAARRGAAATARRLNGKGVALKSPASTPRRGRIGIYARNGAVATVGVSASGRRMYFQAQASEVRTNALAPLDQLGPVVVPRGVQLPTAAFPAPGEPLPGSSDPEISARRAGTQTSIDFTGSARDALPGKRITVSCVVSTKTLTGATAETTTGTHAAPAAGKPLTLAIPTRYHLCAVSYGDRFARVALDDAGRAALEEGTLAAAMQRVLRSAAAAAAPGYPGGQAIADSFNGDVVALAAPTDTPPDLRVGAWSDAARKLTLVGVARTGRRLFLEIDGDSVRSNAFTVPDLP